MRRFLFGQSMLYALRKYQHLSTSLKKFPLPKLEADGHNDEHILAISGMTKSSISPRKWLPR